jgi:hypothetical protein
MRSRRPRWRLGLGSLLGSAVLLGGYLAVPVSAAAVSQTFLETGSLQSYAVPSGVCGLTVVAMGGSGGGASGTVVPPSPGGRGATVGAHLSVTPGEILQIVVGGAGGAPGNFTGGAGGFGGGGGAGGPSGGGGGASSVFNASGPLLTAGGGGGAVNFFGGSGPGGNAGLIGADAQAGGGSGSGGGGTAGGDGGTGSNASFTTEISTGGGGGVSHGGASEMGGVGGNGLDGFGGGGGAPSQPTTARPGSDAGPTQIGSGGLGFLGGQGFAGGVGGHGTTEGGDGADSASGVAAGGGGGGGGGVGFGGGGGGWVGGGGGGGYGAGAGGFAGGGSGFAGGGGGGSSWVTPDATSVTSALSLTAGDGRVTIAYDSVSDLCTAVLPGSGIVTAPTTGTADLAVSVTLSTPSALTVTVHWATEFIPGAPANPWLGPQAPVSDYTPSSGTVTFAPGITSATVHIPVLGDSSSGPDEFMAVSFTDPTNAKMGGFGGLAFGIIANNDHPTVLPGLDTIVAPTSGTADLAVPVTLTNPSTLPVTVAWNTLNVPGAPDSTYGPQAPVSDYTPSSGTITFAPGDTTAEIHIPVNADSLTPGEYIVVSFHDPTNAYMGGYWGLGFGIITPAP